MKKKLTYLFSCLFAFSFFGTMNAQTDPIYQLPNGGFEEWYIDGGGSSGATGPAPVGFNSFHSAYCTSGILGTCQGVAQRCQQVTDKRPGSPGQYSLRMYSNTVLTVRANGNVTTGRIYMGSTSANNVNNYNYADYNLNSPKFFQEITGTPDSLRFWVKYLPGSGNNTDKGRIRAYIHGTGPCRDAPVYPAGTEEIDLYYGKTMKEFYREGGEWHCYQVPFVYDGYNNIRNANGNYYVLLSMTTNAIPGGGSGGADQAWFDDVEFIYSAWLTDLKVNGETIEGFQKNLLTYGGPKLTGYGPYEFPYQPENFTYTREVDDSTVEITNVDGPDGDADGGYTRILVTAEDGVTTKEYRVYYYAHLSDDNTITAVSYTIDNGDNSIPVPGFTPTQANYSITLTDPEQAIFPKIVVESIVLSDPAATIQNIAQPTGVNATGTVYVQAENFKLKEYHFTFSKVKSSNSKVEWIRVGTTDITDFHPDTLTYYHELTACTATIPAVSALRSSIYATIGYTQATTTTKTATITVTAEDGTQTIYTINFALTNNNTVLSGYRVASTNRNNSFTAANNYTDVYSAAHTSFPALALSTTTAQQGCAQQDVEFPLTNNVVFFPDTNYIKVTAQDGITKQTYKSVLKNTNCYLKQTTGNNVGLKYLYNGVVRNITIPSASTNNDVTVNVTIPVAGPNVPPVLIEADPQAPVVDTIIYVQPIYRAGNSGSVTVYPAHDNGTSKKYIINFTPTISTDSTLSYITYNGLPVPGFAPATETYTIICPSSVTEVPILEFSPTFEWLPEENIVYTPAASLNDTAVIEVTAENGAKKTYKLFFEVVEQAKDAYLIDIRYDNKTIAGFSPLTSNYTENIPYSAPTPPEIVPYASSPTAFIFPSIQLNEPPYTKSFLVYSEDMTVQRTYTVSFNLVKNTNSFLSDIKINGVSLQDFNSQEFNYEHEFPYTEWNAPVVTATPAFQHALVDIAQIDATAGTVTITVTAEDDAYSSIYTIVFTRELSPITDISTIVYEYNDDTYSYNVGENETEITIMLPIETEGEATITNIQLADSRADYEIEEQPDETSIVTVTAEDSSTEVYTIAFERTLSPNTLLTNIWYNGVPVPDFNPNILTYSILLPFNTSQIPNVTAAAAWKNTVVTIDQAQTTFGQATVFVTSEDGQEHQSYTINFLRKGSPYLLALFYNLDGNTFQVPGFNALILDYNIVLPLATTAVPTLDYIALDESCSIENIGQNEPNGTSSIKVVTWNQDDSVTYTVTFTVPLSTEAILSDLQVDGVTLSDFNPEKLNYVIGYEYGKEDLPVVAATATQIDAIVDIEQIEEYPGVATVTVTAGVTTITRIYTISFSVEPGNNTYLSEIMIDDNSFWLFNKAVYFYTLDLPFGTVQVPVIEATAEDTRSSVEILQAEHFGDTAKITVTALNGDVAVYQIYFPVPKNINASASMIYVDWKPLEDFLPYISDYTVTLPHNYTGKPLVSVDLQDPNASYEKIFTDDIPLVAKIIVTAENGENQFTYTVNFIKETSIIDYSNETKIMVYPNPTSGIIHFEIKELEQAATLDIFSVEGKNVGKYTLQTGINTLNISHLQDGFYFFKAFTDKTMLGAGKFVKN